ncbi:hypothetical protein [Aeromicrobium sp. IC_218]|uniref:hypothetical protein n=1 Tax=Aeromicrobium sp. IC_218 TaxID=2545468 RepID=UPI001038A61E|nr:hypothetical protein [Aeromicrobium sp. IC_218]TCI97770.1 hypothetical protein E0W78_10665 [Aeromicrobium sp. IC_218]
MGSSATTTIDLAVTPDRAVAAVQRVVADNRFTPGEPSPDGHVVAFRTRKTMLSWELDAVATVTEAGAGSRVELTVDTAPGRPKALLDGKKNRKSVEKLAAQVEAAATA